MESNRTRYLVAYDICNPKRLSKMHKKVEAYAIGGQKSFYECWLTGREFLEFKAEIAEIMQYDEDRVVIFQLHSDTQPILFGTAHLQSTQPFLIV